MGLTTNIQYYLSPACIFCKSVSMLFAELDLEVSSQKVDLLRGEQKQAWFVKMNPLHTVPLIDDDGFLLWESHAILGYIVMKYGQDKRFLYPEDPQQRATVDRFLYFNSGNLSKNFSKHFAPMLYEGYELSDLEPSTANAFKQDLEYLDCSLRNSTYLCGDKLTVADLSLSCTVEQVRDLGWNLDSYSNLSRWLQELAKLPYYKKIQNEGFALLRSWMEERKKQRVLLESRAMKM